MTTTEVDDAILLAEGFDELPHLLQLIGLAGRALEIEATDENWDELKMKVFNFIEYHQMLEWDTAKVKESRQLIFSSAIVRKTMRDAVLQAAEINGEQNNGKLGTL